MGRFCSKSVLRNRSEPQKYRENFYFILSGINLHQLETLHQIELKDMVEIVGIYSKQVH